MQRDAVSFLKLKSTSSPAELDAEVFITGDICPDATWAMHCCLVFYCFALTYSLIMILCVSTGLYHSLEVGW